MRVCVCVCEEGGGEEGHSKAPCHALPFDHRAADPAGL